MGYGQKTHVGGVTPREYPRSLPPSPPPGPSRSPMPPSFPAPIPPLEPGPAELVLSDIQGRPRSFCGATIGGACASRIVAVMGRRGLAFSGNLGGARLTDHPWARNP